MRVLALDTTTRAGSVALVDENVIVEERPGELSRTHAQRLPAEVLAVLDAHGIELSAIDVFAVAAGPGRSPGCASASPRSRGSRLSPGAPLSASPRSRRTPRSPAERFRRERLWPHGWMRSAATCFRRSTG